ncbi:MAG: CAP domain-containing protein [Candidatus Berkelbacteria bacterium]|nr:CAP domain-containing protein [Candidatus Berkelbacteria bacterium]
MKNKYLIITVLTSINLTLIGLFTVGFQKEKVTAATLSEAAYQDLALVNDLRSKSDHSSLVWNEKLAQAARLKANDIIDNDYFEHSSPKGKTAWSFIEDTSYSYRFAGENLAIDFSNVYDAQEAWEKSPTHLKNILSDNFTDFGFAEVEGEVDGQFSRVYVQLFGKPLSVYERELTTNR